jgi:hypothetical protein
MRINIDTRIAKAEKEVKESKVKNEEYVEPRSKLGHEARGTNPSRPLPPAPKGSTQSGGRKASSQPAKPRKLQKKPPGPSKPEHPWRNMKPIGEYPSPAEYRGAGVVPSAKRVAERVATTPASAPRKEHEPEPVGSDSGVENLTVEKGHVEYLAKEVTVVSPTPDIETPDIETPDETPDETTPTIASAAEITSNTPDYLAVFEALPIPTSDKFDITRLRGCIKLSLMHAIEHGSHTSAATLLYFWSHAITGEYELSLIHNLAKGKDADRDESLALQCRLKDWESDAVKWYQNYIGAAAVELPSGSDSGVSSGNPAGPEPGFKVSDIYRDTSGPRLEEQFMSGKSNTAPIKRPKKPCPVNENAFKRKRQWEADPDLESTLQDKRARYKATQHTGFPGYVVEYSSCREERGPPDAIEHPYTFDDTTVIERSRSLPVSGSILDIPIVKGPEPPAPSVYSSAPSLVARRAGKPVSRRQREKAKLPETTQRARSLSIDTTVSSLSSLSNSAYSVRFNEWVADHQPRQMPNSMYVSLLI